MKATRLNHLEEIVKKKIELEKLQDKKKDLENIALRENTRLEAIKEEQERRDYKSLKNLERIISKAENIDQALKRGDLDRQNQVLLASALEEGGDHAEKQRKRMVDEIIAKRQREQQQNLLDQEQKIKELNEERWKILSKHEDLLKKKQIHAKLVERGVDFLAEIELGQAPPKELIMQNLGKIEISSDEMYKPTHEILSEVSDELNHLDARIKALRDQKEGTLRYIQWINRPYNGEADIRRERPDLSLDTYVAMKELVYDLVDETWQKIAKFESDLDIINKNRNYYEHKSQVIEGTLDYLAIQQLMRIVTLQYVEDVVIEMTNDIAGDILSICKFSENIMFKFVGAAIAKHKNIKNEEEVPNYLKSLLKL
ncbi:unnamed protein product [Blepharisma stoltei]|uniref:Uncharacterized protein n=1 Tax=Blepharisma stoltei TaxID=1481888 RepID=A0AAU9IYY4_9CILI|nr:unnamed protein product [Blepharisma stoltei]